MEIHLERIGGTSNMINSNLLYIKFQKSHTPSLILNVINNNISILDFNESCSTLFSSNELNGHDPIALLESSGLISAESSSLFHEAISNSLSEKRDNQISVVIHQNRCNQKYLIDIIPLQEAKDSVNISVEFHIQLLKGLSTAPEDIYSNKLFNNSLDIMCVIDREGKFVKVSSASEKIWGYSSLELKNQHYINFVHPEYHDQTLAIADAVIQGKEYLNFENKYIKKDGSLIDVQWSAKWDEQEELMYCIARNITEIKQEKQKLEYSENRFKRLVQEGSDLIAIIDISGTYQYVSPTSFTILGYAPEDLLNKSALDYIHPEDISYVLPYLEKVFTTKKLKIAPYRFKNSKGEWRWVETVITNLIEDVTVNGIVANSRDVTERIEWEKELKKSEEKYKFLFHNSPLPKWIYDLESLEILDVNHTAEQIYGYNREEFIGMNIEKLRPSEEITNLYKYINELKNNDAATYSGNFIHIKKDNSTFKVEVTGQKIEYLDRTCMLVVIVDVTEKENALDLLRDHQSKLISAQQIAKLGYWKLNLSNNNLYWSDEIFQIWEIPKKGSTIHVDTFMDTLHPLDREEFNRTLELAIQGICPQNIEHRIILPNGSIKWVHERGKVIKDGQGQPIFFEGTVQDITEKKEAQQALLQSEARHRAILESQTNFVIRTDIEGNFTYVNKKFEREFNWLYEDKLLIGKSAGLCISEHDLPKLRLLANDCLNNLNQVMEVELDNPKKDRGIRNTLLDIICLGDSAGKPVEFQAVGLDISYRKQVEETLLESQRRYEYVIQATSDAIWDYDIQTGHVVRGIGFEKLFGYNSQNLKDTNDAWTSLIHPQDQDRVLTELQAFVFNIYNTTLELEYRCKRADGSYAYVCDRGIIIRDEKGNAIRIVGAVQDISERKEAEQKLHELNTHLQEQAVALAKSNAELEQFAYVASHDLQEPLRMVTSFLKQIERKYSPILDEKGKKYIYFAVDGAERMKNIILDLLAYSRVGRSDDPTTWVDLNDLVKEVQLLLHEKIKESHAIITVDKLPNIFSHKSPLLQVFLNLIKNALHYQYEGNYPQICIRNIPNLTHWQFEIQDNGIGIHEDYIDNIFIMFNRLHNREEYLGNGMGLAITKKIIENLGGEIWVKSKEKEGSTFIFTILKQ